MSLKDSTKSFVDFFLPRLCLCCGIKLDTKQRVICPSCYSSIQLATEERIEQEYKKKFASEHIISGLFSAFIFQTEGSLQSLLHQLKYKQRFRIGNLLGGYLAENIYEQVKIWQIDFITAMPLHKLKQAERGYNQSIHIAATLGKHLKIPVKNNYVKRIKFTDSQTKLNMTERKQNITGAFKVMKNSKLKGRRILLLDDVITTGASISELGKVIIESGASKVYACSVALAD